MQKLYYLPIRIFKRHASFAPASQS